MDSVQDFSTFLEDIFCHFVTKPRSPLKEGTEMPGVALKMTAGPIQLGPHPSEERRRRPVGAGSESGLDFLSLNLSPVTKKLSPHPNRHGS